MNLNDIDIDSLIKEVELAAKFERDHQPRFDVICGLRSPMDLTSDFGIKLVPVVDEPKPSYNFETVSGKGDIEHVKALLKDFKEYPKMLKWSAVFESKKESAVFESKKESEVDVVLLAFMVCAGVFAVGSWAWFFMEVLK
jgi:hypothetical protein|tara:strand:+ start:491 stop:910 length:420 start_codon:yes stop_codon:yes gene_type:complete